MALYKEVKTRFGINAGYWRVGTITIDRNMKEASFSLNLYLNREAEEFIETHSVSSLMGVEDKSNFNKYFENMGDYTDIANACYMYAKENVEEFIGAEDI